MSGRMNLYLSKAAEAHLDALAAGWELSRSATIARALAAAAEREREREAAVA